MPWISIREYVKRKKLSSVQLIYNRIATGKMKKNIEWREVVTKVKRKEVWVD